MIPSPPCKDGTDGTGQQALQASPGVTACEVDRPDSVSPAAVAERFHTAHAVRRTRAVIGVSCRRRATTTSRRVRCSASQRQGCLGRRLPILRQPRIAGRRALLLLPVAAATPHQQHRAAPTTTASRTRCLLAAWERRPPPPCLSTHMSPVTTPAPLANLAAAAPPRAGNSPHWTSWLFLRIARLLARVHCEQTGTASC